MKFSFRNVFAVVALLMCVAFGSDRAFSQNAGQTITSPLGNELIQVYPANSAAIAYMSSSSLRDGRFYVYATPLTGATITMTVDQSAVALNPAGTIAALTIVMPATVVDGKTVTIYSTQTITSLTLSTTNSATFAPAAVTTFVTATTQGAIGYVYDKANNQWHRYQ